MKHVHRLTAAVTVLGNLSYSVIHIRIYNPGMLYASNKFNDRAPFFKGSVSHKCSDISRDLLLAWVLTVETIPRGLY
jgi:hypothetical protein